MPKPTAAARRRAALNGHATRLRRARAAYLARLKDGGESPCPYFRIEDDGTLMLTITTGKYDPSGRGSRGGYKFRMGKDWIAPLIAQLAEANVRAAHRG